MSVTEHKFLVLACDTCTERACNDADGYMVFESRAEIADYLDACDWRLIDGLHVCPGCYEYQP